MPNNFLILGTLTAFGWMFVSGTSLPSEPMPRSSASRIAAATSATAAYGTGGPTLEARQAPVPLVRSARPPHEVQPLAAPSAATEQQPQEDKKAAKAAIEADGYRRVTVLGKAGNGAWRAKGFRGATEVLLTVDAAGRVSMD